MAEDLGSIKVVLLDIEGTICSISFVKDILFPYALSALRRVLSTKWEEPSFRPYRDAFPPEYTANPTALEAHVHDLMRQDCKTTSLKSLQGYLWAEGYASGALQAPLFPDVPGWMRGCGKEVVIYSSGSVAAQKLFFGHTTAGDLLGGISGYFDTVNAGSKVEAESYRRIVATHRDGAVPTASEWLFLSDNVREVEAAKEAGMRSFVVQRPGNAELDADVEKKHRMVSSFDEIVF